MKTTIKVIKTTVAFGCIIYAIIALGLLDNKFSITTLMFIVLSMCVGFVIGIRLLITTNLDWFNDDEEVITKTLSLTDAYEREIEVLRIKELEYLRLLAEIRDGFGLGHIDQKFINDNIKRIRDIN